MPDFDNTRVAGLCGFRLGFRARVLAGQLDTGAYMSSYMCEELSKSESSSLFAGAKAG